MLDSFLSDTDCGRAGRTLQMLCRHEIGDWVLAGGLAIELHGLRHGLTPALRPLNDIDFVVDEFAHIPETLGADLLFRHVHPRDPVNKTLIQSVFPETALRIDVFRVCHEVISRSIPMELSCGKFRMIALEDLLARNARLSLDLAENKTMPAKHARDFMRLLPFADMDAMEAPWGQQLKPTHPMSFAEAARTLTELIPKRKDLQVVPVYSRDIHAACPHCEATPEFALEDATRFLSLLGYC
jgi:hypothetical protein